MAKRGPNRTQEKDRVIADLLKKEGKEVSRDDLEAFLKEGVLLEHLEDVVDLRNKLTSYDFDLLLTKTNGEIKGQVGILVMCEAYNACEGDISILEEIVAEAEDYLDQVSVTDDPDRSFTTNDFNKALHKAIQLFLDDIDPDDLDYDEEVADDDSDFGVESHWQDAP